MKLRIEKNTIIDKIWHEFYALYKKDINIILSKLHKQESVWGKSALHYKITVYQVAFNYIILLYTEYRKKLHKHWRY